MSVTAITARNKRPRLTAVGRPLLAFWRFEALFVSLRQDWAWSWAYLYAATGILISNVLTLTPTYALSDLKLQALNASEAVVHSAHIGLTIAALIGPFVSPLIRAFFVAFVAQSASMVIGVQVRFSKLYSLAMYTFLPASIIGGLATALLMRLVPIEALSNVTFSPAILFPIAYHHHFLYLLAKTLDIFTVWPFLLFGLGYTEIHRTTWQKSLFVVIGLTCLALVQTWAVWMGTA